VLLFDLLQSSDKGVVLRVGDLGLIEHVVQVLVAAQGFTEGLGFVRGVGWGGLD